ncbi:hypothetical protein [Pseudomonas abietaniphila]|uniref:hypothetical protein n=1 Tax=Pseudomonas abietaniphila TaxID=89065 RepID=UPI000A72E125|nr:hypothetical protein [Pseudomonas abietaniphila]
MLALVIHRLNAHVTHQDALHNSISARLDPERPIGRDDDTQLGISERRILNLNAINKNAAQATTIAQGVNMRLSEVLDLVRRLSRMQILINRTQQVAGLTDSVCELHRRAALLNGLAHFICLLQQRMLCDVSHGIHSTVQFGQMQRATASAPAWSWSSGMIMGNGG